MSIDAKYGVLYPDRVDDPAFAKQEVVVADATAELFGFQQGGFACIASQHDVGESYTGVRKVTK